MITLLWEDECGLDARRFGPHVLVVACVADELGIEMHERRRLEDQLLSFPKKGNGNVVRAIREDLADLQRVGPVMAVLDSDQIGGLLGEPLAPDACLVRSAQLTRAKFPGDYRLLLLERSVDTLVTVACSLTAQSIRGKKATPDERDRVLCKLAWQGSRTGRDDLRARVPTFDRLVGRLGGALESVAEMKP